jgi:L-lysine 2,3-aminomutase
MHDKITGTAHFSVPTIKAKKIFKELTSILPGYLVPKLVKEVPGYKSKCSI